MHNSSMFLQLLKHVWHLNSSVSIWSSGDGDNKSGCIASSLSSFELTSEWFCFPLKSRSLPPDEDPAELVAEEGLII
jgi:hypothetical protein